jgi:hypothetical protein
VDRYPGASGCGRAAPAPPRSALGAVRT